MREVLNDDISRLKSMIARNIIIDDAKNCYLSRETIIGDKTHIEPNVITNGTVEIGRNSYIGSNSILTDCRIGDNCVIISSVIENSIIGNNVSVGPYAYLCNNAVIEDNCRDIVEIKTI